MIARDAHDADLFRMNAKLYANIRAIDKLVAEQERRLAAAASTPPQPERAAQPIVR